jgi:hypothetical protein
MRNAAVHVADLTLASRANHMPLSLPEAAEWHVLPKQIGSGALTGAVPDLATSGSPASELASPALLA